MRWVVKSDELYVTGIATLDGCVHVACEEEQARAFRFKDPYDAKIISKLIDGRVVKLKSKN